MNLISLVVLCLVLGVWSAPSTTPYSIHEKRRHSNDNWTLSKIKINERTIVPFSIGLTQRNLEDGHHFLMDVSSPDSPNYAKHWSTKKIADKFSPSSESIAAVSSWLDENGIQQSRTKISTGSNWIRFNATISEAEKLLKTRYHTYEHIETRKTHLACAEYSVPTYIQKHIDFISPTINFDAYIVPRKRSTKISSRQNAGSPDSAIPVAQVKPGNAPILPGGLTPQVLPTLNLVQCNLYMTPQCLRALYRIPTGSPDGPNSSFGVFEVTPQAHKQGDLDMFYRIAAPNIPAGTGPDVKLIDGAIVQQFFSGFGYNAESDLDLEYAITLVYPQKVTLFQVGNMVASGSFGTFLDALDGDFCTFDGGDDPFVDPIYPNSGYKSKDCGTVNATSVISISYSYNEADLSPRYEQRQCNEYLKLGLMGITILFASGDNGVAGNTNQCCKNTNCASGGYNPAGQPGFFNPAFPATCPYITAVGATQIKPGASVKSEEIACQTVIYSGGGFSNVFPLPAYQAKAVGIISRRINLIIVREISANGANYVTAITSTLQLVYGTSASTPVVGSMITLINIQRLKVGKRTVGMINPVLYANPRAMNDIKSGGNPGCGTKGFTAGKGWDPVTGLGTMDFVKMQKIWLALP